jgi:hypothetical protein
VAITLTAPPSVTFSRASQSFTLSANVTAGGVAANTGSVTFTVAGQSVASSVLSGTAAGVVTLPGGVAVGSYPITASFSGPPATASATSPFAVVQSPTVINVTSVSDKFGLLKQVETVTAQVQGSNELPVNSGRATLVDGGQTQTVNVSNGLATITFTFSLFRELQTAYPHLLSASYTDTSGNYTGSSRISLAPGNLLGFFYQLLLDDVLVLVLTGSNLNLSSQAGSGSSGSGG